MGRYGKSTPCQFRNSEYDSNRPALTIAKRTLFSPGLVTADLVACVLGQGVKEVNRQQREAAHGGKDRREIPRNETGRGVIRGEQRQQRCAECHPDTERQLLCGAGEAGRPAHARLGNVGIADGIDAGELQRPHQVT